MEAEMEIRSEEGEPDGSEDSEGRSLVGQASALPFQVVDTTAGAEADGVGPMGSVPPTMESSDEEGGPVNLLKPPPRSKGADSAKGCAKCRHALTGCARCNPKKLAAYLDMNMSVCV